jgi:hypothetical protein
MPKIAEMKLSSCRLEVADIRKNCDCGIAELRLRSNISVKCYGIAIAEVFPSSCGIAIADSKISCVCPPLLFNDIRNINIVNFGLMMTTTVVHTCTYCIIEQTGSRATSILLEKHLPPITECLRGKLCALLARL